MAGRPQLDRMAARDSWVGWKLGCRSHLVGDGTGDQGEEGDRLLPAQGAVEGERDVVEVNQLEGGGKGSSRRAARTYDCRYDNNQPQAAKSC